MHSPIACRVRADRDIFMIPYAKDSPLDPASYDPARGSHLVTKQIVGLRNCSAPTYGLIGIN